MNIEVDRVAGAPPRRRSKVSTKEKILNNAERAFAAHGYRGTSLRQIAAISKVNQALINYYFGSKEKLFHAIFLRRGSELADERIRMLDELERGSPGALSLEDVIYCFIAPVIRLKRQGPGGIAFLRLQARLQIEPEAVTKELRNLVYDETMDRFTAAFQRALPGSDPDVLLWRMTMMVGAYLYIISDFNRLEHLSKGRLNSRDTEESLRQLISFLISGFTAPEPGRDGARPGGTKP